LKLGFTGQSVDEPVLSEVARKFSVDNNIICGQMDYAGGVKFGVMLIEVFGAAADIEKAIAYYESKHIKTEVLGYV